jgi:hypothetical protein
MISPATSKKPYDYLDNLIDSIVCVQSSAQ